MYKQYVHGRVSIIELKRKWWLYGVNNGILMLFVWDFIVIWLNCLVSQCGGINYTSWSFES